MLLVRRHNLQRRIEQIVLAHLQLLHGALYAYSWFRSMRGQASAGVCRRSYVSPRGMAEGQDEDNVDQSFARPRGRESSVRRHGSGTSRFGGRPSGGRQKIICMCRVWIGKGGACHVRAQRDRDPTRNIPRQGRGETRLGLCKVVQMRSQTDIVCKCALANVANPATAVKRVVVVSMTHRGGVPRA